MLEDCLYYEITDYALWSLSTSSGEIASLLARPSKIKPVHTQTQSDDDQQCAEFIRAAGDDNYLSQNGSHAMSANIISVTS